MPIFLLANTLSAQFVEVSYGTEYTEQAYYKLDSDETTNIFNSDWDIAFSTVGTQDAAIFINEATGSSETALELYRAPTDNFEDAINTDDLTEWLNNDELSWDFGAFNSIRSPDNALDFGWGQYNTTNHIIGGTSVFVLKLRDESYKKIQIESLALGIYTFKYASLDGSNEITQTIDKNDFLESDFAYFSFGTEQTIETIPAEWDLLFTRYTTPIDDGTGAILDYLVTGVLSGTGVEIAQADGVDPETVDFELYGDSLQNVLDIIGYDWKTFDLSTFQWSLPADRAYFVKTAIGDIWKIVFVDFEGSSTGNVVFQKTDLGTISAVEQPGVFTDCNVFPNPVRGEANLTFSLKNAQQVKITLGDLYGRTIWSDSKQATAGFNAQILPNFDLPSGVYYLTLEGDGSFLTRKIIK